MLDITSEINIIASNIQSLEEMIEMKEWVHSLKSKEEQINNISDISRLRTLLENERNLYKDLNIKNETQTELKIK